MGGQLKVRDLKEINAELMTLRRAQLILNTSNAASFEERKAVTDQVMRLLREGGLIAEEEAD